MLMFVVLGLLLSFDQLEGAAIQVLEPEIRAHVPHQQRARSCSSRTASSAFFVLGAVPMGWLADRVKRVPIVGIASLVVRRASCSSRASRSARSCCSGRASPTGIAKANSIPVHQSLLADNYPIGIRARMSAVMNIGAQGIGIAEPGPRRRDRDLGRRRRGLALGVVRARHPGRDRRDRRVLHEGTAARAVREGGRARRGDRGREPGADLDGGGVRPAQEDRDDPHRRSSAFSALGFGLFSRGALAVALPQRHAARARTSCDRGFILSLSGIAGAAVPARSSGATSTARTARTRPRRSCSSAR